MGVSGARDKKMRREWGESRGTTGVEVKWNWEKTNLNKNKNRDPMSSSGSAN
jgi:hypothetical protein